MKIDTLDIESLFFNADSKYVKKTEQKIVVPKNQRQYNWGNIEVEQFLNDLFFIATQTNVDHFFGTMVFCRELGNLSELAVFDGQQRLTTIIILFRAIYQIVNEVVDNDESIERNKNELKSICRSYILTESGNDYKFCNHNSDEFYNRKLLDLEIAPETHKPKSKEEKAFLSNYKKLKELLNPNNICKIFSIELPMGNHYAYFQALQLVIKSLIKKFKIVKIEVQDEFEATRIFETVNARGTPLSLEDLVKNELFKFNIPAQNDVKHDWADISKNTFNGTKASTSNFLRHFWLSKYEFAQTKDIFSKFQNKTQRQKDATKLMQYDLVIHSKHYLAICTANPKLSNQQHLKFQYSSYKAFNDFGVTQIRSFLLALLDLFEKKKISIEDYKICLEKLEKFFFVFTGICSSPAQNIERKFNEFSLGMRLQADSDNDAKTKVRDYLKKNVYSYLDINIPNRSRFDDKFSSIQYNSAKGKKIIYYIFEKLEKLLIGGAHEVSDFTLEHIKDKKNSGENINSIGNLLPLENNVHSLIRKNPQIKRKLEVYKKSSINIVKEFVDVNNECDEWDEEQINKRNKDLSVQVYEKLVSGI